MRLHKDNSFIFMHGNKHGLIKWESKNSLLADEFTILARITPDYDQLALELEQRPVIQQMVLGKNGKHMGLQVVGYLDDSGEQHTKIAYEWWENPTWEENPDPNNDAPRDVKIELGNERIEDIDVVVEKYAGKFHISAHGKEDSRAYDGIIDYSDCFTWIGCGNKTFINQEDNLRHGAIYTGDINLLHIQDGILLGKDKNLFFNEFETFNVYNKATKDNCVYFSSDFKDYTDYKVMDKSANGNHPLVFSREWLDF